MQCYQNKTKGKQEELDQEGKAAVESFSKASTFAKEAAKATKKVAKTVPLPQNVATKVGGLLFKPIVAVLEGLGIHVKTVQKVIQTVTELWKKRKQIEKLTAATGWTELKNCIIQAVKDIVKKNLKTVLKSLAVVLLNLACPGLGTAFGIVFDTLEAIGHYVWEHWNYFFPSKKKDREKCDWDQDCESQACGRQSHELQCCASESTVLIPTGHVYRSFCDKMEDGMPCMLHEQCQSNFCSGDEAVWKEREHLACTIHEDQTGYSTLWAAKDACWRSMEDCTGVLAPVCATSNVFYVCYSRYMRFERSKPWLQPLEEPELAAVPVQELFIARSGSCIYTTTSWNGGMRCKQDAPQADHDCPWDYSHARCANPKYCQYQYQFGDIHLGQSCRIRPEIKKKRLHYVMTPV